MPTSKAISTVALIVYLRISRTCAAVEVEAFEMKTVSECAEDVLGVTVEGGPARFRKGGWFSVGGTVSVCPRCKSTLWGFRKPYTTKAGLTFHYWALVCSTCRTAVEPSELGEEHRKRLYRSSELPPAEAEDIRKNGDANIGMAMKASIRNCKFAFKCPLKWESLAKTTDPDVRFCDECQQEVYFCRSDAELVKAIKLNRCIAITVEDKPAPPRVLMGSPAPLEGEEGDIPF